MEKNKSSFSNELALLKLVYLSAEEAVRYDVATSGLGYDILTTDNFFSKIVWLNMCEDENGIYTENLTLPQRLCFLKGKG